MYDLSQLQRPQLRPIFATLVSEHGLGKTSLAALFPNPVVIRTEDGVTADHDVEVLPICYTSDDVIGWINALGAGEHKFGTLVLDSVSQLNTIIEHEIVAADPKAKSINQAGGGYGAGLSAAAEKHREIRELCGYLSRAKGMNVVFICHADAETIDPPDGDAYTRYTARLGKKAVPHYTDNVDLVAFIKLQTFTIGANASEGKAGKASTNGQRVITCYPTPNHISKNRFGIEADIPFEKGVNPFLEFIPQLKTEA